MKKILIIEDDRLIAELERDYLEVDDFNVTIADNGKKGLQCFMETTYDLIILDIMLPKINGFDLCRSIRLESNVPIIMVTAKKEDVDKIRGLGLGVDDYMVKPFSPSELVARVKAHINIHEKLNSEKSITNQKAIQIQGLKINPLSHEVSLDGKELSLTNKEYELLLFLTQNPNIVFSKNSLFDNVWEMDSLGDVSTVTVHINRLREKLDAISNGNNLIETVWGAGYKFKI